MLGECKIKIVSISSLVFPDTVLSLNYIILTFRSLAVIQENMTYNAI